MYQILIRRKAGNSLEKVGAPIANHEDAVTEIEALLNERFPGLWRPTSAKDSWSINGFLGAKLMLCGPDGKPVPSEMVTVNVRMSPTTRDTLNAIARKQGLMNPKHPDSPNISAAIEWLAAQHRVKK